MSPSILFNGTYTNQLPFFLIGPIRDINIICIFDLFPFFVRRINNRSQYYKITFRYWSAFKYVIMTLNYYMCPILVHNLEYCKFCGYIYFFPATTHIPYKLHHLTTLTFPRPDMTNTKIWSTIRSRMIMVREIVIHI